MHSNGGLSRCHPIPVVSYSVQRIGAMRVPGAAECFDPLDQWKEPFGTAFPETAQRIVVMPAEGRHATFALVLPKLKWL